MNTAYILLIIYGSIIFTSWNVLLFLGFTKKIEFDFCGIACVLVMFWPLLLGLAIIISPAIIIYFVNKKKKDIVNEILND